MGKGLGLEEALRFGLRYLTPLCERGEIRALLWIGVALKSDLRENNLMNSYQHRKKRKMVSPTNPLTKTLKLTQT